MVPNSEASQFTEKRVTPTDHLQIAKFCTKKLEERLREGFRDEKTCILHLKDN